MFIFELNQDDRQKVKSICNEKGYENMSLDELKEVIKGIDKSPNQVLTNHSLMGTKEQIIEFLYGWEWANLFVLNREVIK